MSHPSVTLQAFPRPKGAEMPVIADVDPVDGGVKFRDAATGVPVRKVFPMGGDRRSRGCSPPRILA